MQSSVFILCPKTYSNIDLLVNLVFKTEHSTTVCKDSCIKTDSELQVFYSNVLLLITKLRQRNKVSRQVLALKVLKFVAVILPSLLSGENGVCTPRVGVHKQTYTLLLLNKLILGFEDQKLVLRAKL